MSEDISDGKKSQTWVNSRLVCYKISDYIKQRKKIKLHYYLHEKMGAGLQKVLNIP